MPRLRHSTASASTPTPSRARSSRTPATQLSTIESPNGTATSIDPATTPGPSAPSGSLGSFPLPFYEPPCRPLNLQAQDNLARLQTQVRKHQIYTEIRDAVKNIHLEVGSINDYLHDKEKQLKSRRIAHEKARVDRGDPPSEQEKVQWEKEDKTIKELQEHYDSTVQRIENVTSRMEKSVRKAVDGEKAMEILERGLKDIVDRGVSARSKYQASQSQIAATQTQRSQAAASRRARSSLNLGDSDVDDADDAAADDDTILDTPSLPELPALLTTLQNTIQRLTDAYQSQPLSTRYSKHEHYVQFKRIHHDALHPDQQEMRIDPTRWFNESGDGPAPGVTAGGDDSDDDDIGISRSKMSTRCPLTLKEMEDPVTSVKCPHSFERAAIIDMIKQQRPPTRGAGRAPTVKAVQCPVPGCANHLAQEDLRQDPVVVRRIRRLQKAAEESERRERDGGDGDEVDREEGGRGKRRAEEIESDSEQDIDVVDARAGSKVPRIKTQPDEIEDVDEVV